MTNNQIEWAQIIHLADIQKKVRCNSGRVDVLTCLILLPIPCVPGAHKLTGVFRVSVNGRQDILTEDTDKKKRKSVKMQNI